MSVRYDSDAERILKNTRVDKNGCWIWQKYTDRYGILRWRGKTVKAHWLSFEIFRHSVPQGLSVLHRCDVPACCNPGHLFLGTQTDNMRDCASKGRIVRPVCPPEKKARGDANGMRKHPDSLRGEKNGRSKLTDGQRLEIISLRTAGLHRSAIAAMFDISDSQVNRICREYGRRQLNGSPATSEQE
jgi:hypothetical protein